MPDSFLQSNCITFSSQRISGIDSYQPIFSSLVQLIVVCFSNIVSHPIFLLALIPQSLSRTPRAVLSHLFSNASHLKPLQGLFTTQPRIKYAFCSLYLLSPCFFCSCPCCIRDGSITTQDSEVSEGQSLICCTSHPFTDGSERARYDWSSPMMTNTSLLLATQEPHPS